MTGECVIRLLIFIAAHERRDAFERDLPAALATYAADLPCRPTQADIVELTALLTETDGEEELAWPHFDDADFEEGGGTIGEIDGGESDAGFGPKASSTRLDDWEEMADGRLDDWDA